MFDSFKRGTTYLQHNPEKAISFLKKAGEYKEVFLNLGNAYKRLNNFEKANECYLRASDLDVPYISGKTGEYSQALNNLGLLQYAVGNDVAALDYYRYTLSLDPLHYDAIWNYSIALLRHTRCVDGWKHYEYRFKQSSNRFKQTLPLWDGVTCGRSICVLAEQGIGDKLMFSRYIHLLQQYFETVYIHCHPTLDCFYSDFKVVREPVGDYGIPVCSLANIFGLVMKESWLENKFNAAVLPGNFKIGCVWSGSPTHVNDHNRSCPSYHFSSLRDLGNLFSLVPSGNSVSGITSLYPSSWTATAEYLLGLDLLVSVDTSVVHLAGTLGVPTLLLQPLYETDFRWSYPWYKSVSVISNSGSWNAVFAKVRKCIEQ